MLRTLASRWNKQKFRCYEAKIEESEAAAGFFTFLYFRLITSKLLFNIIIICLFIYMLVMVVRRCVSATKSGIAGGSEATGNLGADQSVAQTGGVLTANLASTRGTGDNVTGDNVTGDNEDSYSSDWSSTDVSENEDQDAGEY